MEKSLIAANGKVSNDIYEDIALVILSKLPLKSLIRFSCASKPWSLLFQNPYFINMFGTNFLSNDTSILLQYCCWKNYTYGTKLYSLFDENFEKKIKINWPKLYEDRFDFKIHGSANGILCIEDLGRRRYIEELGRYVLWNPATGEFQITPTSPFAFESPRWVPRTDFHGFGYDRIRDDYKVIHRVVFSCRTHLDECHSPLWEIYCLKSNLWKKLDIDIPRQYYGLRYYGSMGDLVNMDGVCHWWANEENYTDDQGYEINDQVYLVSFDLNCEVFVKTYIPSNMNDIDGVGTPMIRKLVVLNGTIGCITNYPNTTTFHISILGQVGVKESWTKLFTVGPLSSVEYPIGVGNKGDIFFRKSDGKLVWFNLNTQRIKELGIKGEYGCKIVVYKESFLPFPRIDD